MNHYYFITFVVVFIVSELVKSQQQPAQTFIQAQVSPTTYVPHHPVPLRPQTYQPAFPTMGYCNIVLQPPGPPPEGAYSANPQQPLVYTSSPHVNPVSIPAAYDQRVTIPVSIPYLNNILQYIVYRS